MKLSRDSVLALQRHFLGALRAPARTWLEPLPPAPLVFSGAAIRKGTLDLGSISSPGEERCRVQVCNRSAQRMDVRILEVPPWLTARWLGVDGDAVVIPGGAAGVPLEVRVIHDDEREFHGTLRIAAGSQVEELPVRMTARRTHPLAQFDFNGSAVPHPFEFGTADGTYDLLVANGTSIPLIVTFSDLPGGLTFAVDGRHRSGPIAGPFFERAAPFAVQLRPQFFGLTGGALRLRTNDPRPEMRDIALVFTKRLPAAQVRVRSETQRTPIRTRPNALIVLIGFLFLILLFVIARGF